MISKGIQSNTERKIQPQVSEMTITQCNNTIIVKDVVPDIPGMTRLTTEHNESD